MTPKYKFFDTKTKRFINHVDDEEFVLDRLLLNDMGKVLHIVYKLYDEVTVTKCPHIIAVEWIGIKKFYDKDIIKQGDWLFLIEKTEDFACFVLTGIKNSVCPIPITTSDSLDGFEFIGSSLTNPELLTC